MLSVNNPRDLTGAVGTDLGTGAWRRIDQDTINLYADSIGEHHWIHVDPERAKRDSPTGTTIAHGFHTLSMLVPLLGDCLQVTKATRWLVYGADNVRFPAPVPSGGSIRLKAVLKDAVPLAGDGVKATLSCTVELQGSAKPAAVADFILAIFP